MSRSEYLAPSLSLGGDGLGRVLLVALGLVHGLGVGGGVLLLPGGGLHRGSLLHHALVGEGVQVDVVDEAGQRVLHQALGDLRLLEQVVDGVEHTDSNQCCAQHPELFLRGERGSWGISEKQYFIWRRLKVGDNLPPSNSYCWSVCLHRPEVVLEVVHNDCRASCHTGYQSSKCCQLGCRDCALVPVDNPPGVLETARLSHRSLNLCCCYKGVINE